MWTFGRRIALGFALCTLLLAGVGAVAYRALGRLMQTRAGVAQSHANIEALNAVLTSMINAETGQRGFIITGNETYLEPYNNGTAAVQRQLTVLRQQVAGDTSAQRKLDEAEPLITARLDALKQTLEVRRTGGIEAAAKLISEGRGKRLMDNVRVIFGQLEGDERERLNQRAREASAIASEGENAIIFGTLLALLVAVVAGFTLTRSLGQQIGGSAMRMQSSSAELQTAANQQATGAKQLAVSMAEITTTLTELLATSRQISESAQRVGTIALQTSDAAKAGDGTVDRGQDSMGGIRRQVDLVVQHMLDLGKKSQQIGQVLDILAELAEQTNILAINATIEASGAGDAGKRFSVVADEIRKLADRVQSSAKEVRAMIEDVRSSVNTTVMATETGSKVVDAGARQFGDVATSFKQIATLVMTTSDAAREISLSTKQQTTAVEQVNIAISSLAQASKETEISTNQTLQTASELATLSRELLRIVQPHENA